MFRHWVLQVPKYHVVFEYKIRTLYSDTGTVLEYWCEYLEKRCIHTRPMRVILGHHAWVPSVSIAYKLTLISWLELKLPNCLACSEQHVYSIPLVKTPLNVDGPARSLMCWV